MNQVITAIFDGQVFHPEKPLKGLEHQRYQVTIQSLEPEVESSLVESAQLYAEIYEEDEDLQQLTESALSEWNY